MKEVIKWVEDYEEVDPERVIIRCKDCVKKKLCLIFRDVKQDFGFCAWAEREKE